MESIIHDRQQEYYAAINTTNEDGESTVFIEFVLSAIKASLRDAINASDEMSDGPMDKAMLRWKQIEKFLETHPHIMNADVRMLCGVSAATANRILAGLTAEGNIVKYREGGHWAYRSNICVEYSCGMLQFYAQGNIQFFKTACCLSGHIILAREKSRRGNIGANIPITVP